MKKVLFALPLAGVFAALIGTQSAKAAPITLTPFPTNPDVFVDTGRVVYTASTHLLTLTGTAESNSGSPLTSGTFTANLTLVHVSGTGSTEVFSVGSGNLTVSSSAGTIFSSITPKAFGYSPTTADFQIVYSSSTGTGIANDGDVAVSFHDGTSAGAYLTSFFDADFSSSNVVKIATADVFNVPEPTSLALLTLAAPALIGRRRRA